MLESSSEKCYWIDVVDLYHGNQDFEHVPKSVSQGPLESLAGPDFTRRTWIWFQRIPQIPRAGWEIGLEGLSS